MRTRPTTPLHFLLTLALIGVALLSPPGAEAQIQVDPPRPISEPPKLADAVTSLLEAPFLRVDEAKDLRVFHGLWKPEDLDTPARRALAALIDGRFDDPSLADPAADPLDRAEAMLSRGRASEAIRLIGDLTTPRARRLRAEAFESLGERDRAAAEADGLRVALAEGQLQSPADAVEGVRAMRVLVRLRPQQQPAGGDFRRMMANLGAARERGGRLDWRIPLAEAELLFEKHNRPEGGQAVTRALSLNPRAARAWHLVGLAAVDGFDFQNAEAVAGRIEVLADEPSPLAADVLARARLKQNDPGGANEAIEPILDDYGETAAMISLRASIAAAEYRPEIVEGFLRQHDALEPGSPDALLDVGRTLSDARQYEMAAGYLRRAAERAPFRAEPHAQLGLMGLQSGDDARAVESLARAAELDPFDSRVENSLKLARELQTYARIETPHFVIRHKPGVDLVLAEQMPDALEAMHRRVTGSGPGGIDHVPDRKTIIDLMPDHRWFSVRIAGVTRIHTMAASTGPTIAMESPREGPGHSIGAYDWLRVVRHEYTHTVSLSRTRNRIPHWFTEAAAVYLEDSPRDYSACKMLEAALEAGELFDLTSINLAFIRPRRPTDRSLAYAQSHWMYEFIITRWGERAPLDLMDRYAEGDRESRAFPHVLKVSTAEFLADFKAWAREQLTTWGLGQRPGEPTIAQVLLAEAAGDEPGRERLAGDLGKHLEDVASDAAAGANGRHSWEPELPAPNAEMARRWLDRYPKSPDILEAAIRFALKDADGKPTPEIVPLLHRYAEVRPVDPLPHQLLARLALERVAAGDGGSAAEASRQAIAHLQYLDAREQNSPVYSAELARLYARGEDWTRAQAFAARAVTISPYDAPMRELAARVAIQCKDFATARRHLVALTHLEPTQQARHQQRIDALDRLTRDGTPREK
ncbi:MAG: peptidase MA family metallohydrolase [Phycisphaerales bacterium]